MKVIKTENKTYRVNSIETRSVYTGNNTYEDKEFASCEYLYKGEWHKVKNPTVERRVAVLYREQVANC